MGSIFERAETVVIWLGPSTGDSDLAMATMASITDVAMACIMMGCKLEKVQGEQLPSLQ